MATKKKKKPSTRKGPRFQKLKEFLNNKTNHTVFGIFLIFTTIFFVVAFISYLANWKSDQSELQMGFLELMANPDYRVNNVLGKMGAAVGHARSAARGQVA